MEVLRTPEAMRAWRCQQPAGPGLVPTMGYLHEGHLALVRRSLAENPATVVSIFVNPTQFGPGEDLERYPRDEERDLGLLHDLGANAVYAPDAASVYPDGYQTYVAVEELTKPLEGAARPSHFRGVTTVVLKLFNAVGPARAYFGRKDAQQLRVIQRMARDLDLGVEVVPCPIVREPDGLALSSRNVYLTPDERRAAPAIARALHGAQERYEAGERDAAALRAVARDGIEAEPLLAIEYVSLADDATLAEIDGSVERPALLSVAVRAGVTRLIDNVELT